MNQIVAKVTEGEAVQRAQAIVRRYVPAERDLADELIRDRRQEAIR